MPAPNTALPRLHSRKVATDVALDALWEGVEPVALCDTVTGEAASQPTRVKTLWDEACWHVRFEIEDFHIWATYRSRDLPLWKEEVVEAFVDPIGDLEGYFEIEINPLGTVKDLVLRRVVSGLRRDFSWSVEGLQSGVGSMDGGWTATLSIPFPALGVETPTAGDIWRANFLRIDRPNGPNTEADLSAWSPTGLRLFHRPDKFGFVEFVR